MSTPCSVMVLRAVSGGRPRRDGRPPLLTKTLARDPDGSWRIASEYDRAFLVDAQEFPVASIDDLFALMQRAEPEVHMCFVRARLKNGATQAFTVRRLLYGRADAEAVFEPAPRRWVSLDLDSFPLPKGVTATDIPAVIDAAIARLPEPFRQATCIWQATSGHAIKPGGRVRLWFWLSRALGADELKAWLGDIPAKPDPSVWAPVQPNYVARPECIGGPDFLPIRMGLQRGAVDEVQAPGQVNAQHRAEGTRGNIPSGSRGLGFDGYVERIGDQPGYPLGEGFHEPLKSAVAAAIRDDPDLNVHELEEQLAAVIRERGHTRPAEYIANRLRDLPRLITGISRMEKDRQARKAAGPAEVVPPEGWQPPSMLADEAAAALREPLEAFWRQTETASAKRLRRMIGIDPTPPAWTPGSGPDAPQHLIKVDVGTGKTEQALATALRFTAGRFADEASPRPEGAERRVAFFVNDHRLGQDLLRRAESMQPGCAQLWVGLERPDPDEPGATMCRRLEDVRELLAAKGEAQDLCGSLKRGYCPHHPKAGGEAPPCAYRRQRDLGTPIVIIAGPSSLVQSPPRSFGRKVGDTTVDPFDAVVVDETRPTELFGGMSGHPRRVKAGVFLGTIGEPAIKGRLDRDDIAITADRIGRIGEMLEDATANMPAGQRRPLTLRELRSVGMAADDWRLFRKALFNWVVKPTPDPRLTGPALVEALAGYKATNKRFLGLARLAFCAAQALDDNPGAAPDTRLGQISVETGEEAGFVLAWRETIAKPLENASMLVLDGTANADLLWPWMQRIKVTAKVEVAAPPGVEIVQVWDRRCGYRSWTPQGDATAADATPQTKTAERNLERLARWLELLARTYGDVAAIVPMTTEAWLREHWDKPPVQLAHFGAIRGFDGFRDVRCLVVWSRPAPGPIEMERFAAIYRGSWGATVGKGGWYVETPRPHLVRDGTARHGQGDRHPDAVAEAYRVQITEAELVQAIGRSRWARRDPSRPLTVFVGTNTPLPIQVDRLVTLKSLLAEATPVDDLIGKGIVPAESKGQWALFAAALGKTAAAWRMFCSDNPNVAARLTAARQVRSDAETPIIYYHMGVSAPESCSLWEVLLPGSRYRAGVFLDGVENGDQQAALLKLADAGVVPAQIKAGRRPRSRATSQPSPMPTEPIVVPTSSDPIPFPMPERPEPEMPTRTPDRAWWVGYWKPRDAPSEDGEQTLSNFDEVPARPEREAG